MDEQKTTSKNECECPECEYSGFVKIGYDTVEFDEQFHHDLIGLELIHDALLKALKEVNKRIIKEAGE